MPVLEAEPPTQTKGTGGDEQKCIECGSGPGDCKIIRCSGCNEWLCIYCAEDVHDCRDLTEE